MTHCHSCDGNVVCLLSQGDGTGARTEAGWDTRGRFPTETWAGLGVTQELTQTPHDSCLPWGCLSLSGHPSEFSAPLISFA